MKRESHQRNRLSWNAATVAHHKTDQALFPEELELLGPLASKRLLHLQCNAGQDTRSLARLGAITTGVDISDDAIRLARESYRGTFERADVYDYLATVEPRFDIVFCSYGWLCWLSDLDTWARGVARALVPGGRFVTVEYALTYPYTSSGTPMPLDRGVTDYVSPDFQNPHPADGFNWSLAELFNALIAAGLTIDRFIEYPHSNKPLFDDMKSLANRRFTVPDGKPEIPLMFGISASKR